jgi:hypothetical protein
MNIEVTKYELINKLVSTTDERLLEQLVAVFKKSGKKTERISVAQYNKELDAAEARITSGKFTTQEDLELESEGW